MQDRESNEHKKLIEYIPIVLVVAAGAALMLYGISRLYGTGAADSSSELQDPVKLDWYINYSWYSQNWGENLVSSTITDLTGVTIDFQTPPGNEAEKLGALVASNSLPDLVTLGWWETQLKTMIDEDMVYSLNELADTYCPELWDNMDQTIVDWYTQEDGNLYWYPNSSITPQDLEENDNISSNQVFLVRSDIYKAIGSPDMTTREGFADAVRKAAEMFPEVDGEPLIPIGAHVFTPEGCTSFDQYLQNFLAIPYEKDGALYDRFTDPEYISWLKMFRQLGEEGYLSNDIFIDQRTQMEEKIAAGRYFCMLYQYSDMLTQQTELYTADPEKIYIAVEGPKNEAGDDYRLPSTGINGWTVTLISKNCKAPERAVKFLNFMLSEEGQKLIYLGVEGVTYDMIDGRAVLKEEVSELLSSSRQEYDEQYGADDAYWMLQDNVMQLQWKQEKSEAITQLEEWSYPYVIYNGQYDTVLTGGTREAVIEAKINLLWSDTLKNLLLAQDEAEFDLLLEDFVQEREELGYSYLKEVKWDYTCSAKEKLGIAD